MNEINQPLVSIIIPVFNAEKHLEETINSALLQTWPNIEIIIVDDGSTDQSVEVARSFNNEKIKIYWQINKGASAARNTGLSKAEGEYIQFLDADDLLMPNKISLQINQLAGKPNSISICPFIHFGNHHNNLTNLNPDNYELSFFNETSSPFEFLLKLYGAENNEGGMIPIHCWLTPIDVINKAGKWNEKLTRNDDGEFFCRAALNANQILVAATTACYYRKYTDNSSLSAQTDIKSIKSQYLSILLRKDHLKKTKNDRRIDLITVRSLMDLLMITYPQYKKLSATIFSDIKQCNEIVPIPVIGGKIIEFIKETFGWKFARKIQFYFKRFTI